MQIMLSFVCFSQWRSWTACQTKSSWSTYEPSWTALVRERRGRHHRGAFSSCTTPLLWPPAVPAPQLSSTATLWLSWRTRSGTASIRMCKWSVFFCGSHPQRRSGCHGGPSPELPESGSLSSLSVLLQLLSTATPASWCLSGPCLFFIEADIKMTWWSLEHVLIMCDFLAWFAVFL